MWKLFLLLLLLFFCLFVWVHEYACLQPGAINRTWCYFTNYHYKMSFFIKLIQNLHSAEAFFFPYYFSVSPSNPFYSSLSLNFPLYHQSSWILHCIDWSLFLSPFPIFSEKETTFYQYSSLSRQALGFVKSIQTWHQKKKKRHFVGFNYIHLHSQKEMYECRLTSKSTLPKRTICAAYFWNDVTYYQKVLFSSHYVIKSDPRLKDYVLHLT